MMQLDDINKKYGIPNEEISCPSCGMVYGHHKTKVNKITEECSACDKIRKNKYGDNNPDNIENKKEMLISAEEFIENVLEYEPFEKHNILGSKIK
jgi:hypothetical protein